MAWWDSGDLGIKVERAAAADDQNVATAIYTIAGGIVIVRAIIGVRTVIQAGGASNYSLSHSVGPTVLCAVLAIAGDTVNTIYYITGDATDPVQRGLAYVPVMGGRVVATATRHGGFGTDILMGPGNITHLHTAAAGTGSTRYVLFYIPIDQGATVVAA